MLTRRGLITGAAALAAYSEMEDAEAVNRLLLLGGVPHLPGSAVDMNFAAGQYYGGALSSLISVSRASQGYVTNSDGTLTLVGNNLPRIGRGTGLLIEQQSTNLNLYSQQLANGYWNQDNTVTVQTNLIAPDGSLTGNTISTSTAAPTACRIAGTITVPVSTVISIACIAKQGSANLGLNYSNGGGVNVAYGKFTLSGSGSVSGTSGGATASITPLSGGWYLCNIILTTGIANGYSSAGPWDGSADNFSYPATSSLCNVNVWSIWTEQLSFPTSYIPTTSSTVARAADVVSIIGAGASSIAFPFSTYFNVGPLPPGNNSNSIGFNSALSGVSNSNGSSNILGTYNGSTLLSVNLGSGLWSTGVQHAESFTSNNQAICGNAGSVGSLAQSIGTLVPSQYRLGGYGSGNQINGYMRRFAIFNYAVSNNALQALT